MPGPYPKHIRHRIGNDTIAFRTFVAGEEEALPPEFARSHEVMPPYPVAATHVNWEAIVSSAEPELFPALDIEKLADDEYIVELPEEKVQHHKGGH